MPSNIEVNLDNEERVTNEEDLFGILMEYLVRYISDGSDKAEFLIDRHAVADFIRNSINDNFFNSFKNIDWARRPFHELKAPLDQVAEILNDDANKSRLVKALGSTERYKDFLCGLEDIARAVPTPPKRKRGKPTKTADLYAMVEPLVEYWEKLTGQPVKFTGHNKKAVEPPDDGTKDRRKPAVKFIYDAVFLIDHSRLDQLPGVLEKVVADRRALNAK